MSAIYRDSKLADLLIEQDQASIYNAALTIAQTLGLPTTSWQAGDPTRSLLFIEAQLVEALETIVVGFIQSGFLDYAQGQWLIVKAKQDFGIDVPGATFAETSVTLTNSGGGYYEFEPGDITVKNSTTGATYHNTTSGVLTSAGITTTSTTPGDTLVIDVIADAPGAAGSSAAGAINTLVTTFLGVSCTNPVAAVGVDAQAPETTVQQCRDKAASFSPNGPADAYRYVALNRTLTGIQTVTRARVYDDSTTGKVLVYVAGRGGVVAPSDVTAVQNAINTWAAPRCFTPTVVAANPVTINVTYSLWLYSSVGQTSAQIQAAVQTALASFFAARPISGDTIPPATSGAVYQDMIQSVIAGVFEDETFRVVVSAPADTALNQGDVAVLGTVTATITIVDGP